MDKKILYVIGAIFIGAILFVTCYMMAENKLLNSDIGNINNQKREIKDKIAFKNIKKSGNKIIETFSITMNGKKTNFQIEYTSSKKESETEIKGIFKGKTLYSKIASTAETPQEDFSEKNIKAIFTENNFRFIKGTDEKTYLLVLAPTKKHDTYRDYLYILNEKFEFIEGDMNYNGCGETGAMTVRTNRALYETQSPIENFEDQFGLCANGENCKINVKIEESKIRYLKVFPKYEEFNFGNIEERVYTISDDKLNYTVENTHTIVNANHEMCQ